MRILLVVLFVVWCAPVKLGAALRWREGEKGVILLGVTLWGFRFIRKVIWPERKPARLLPRADRLQENVEAGEGGMESDRQGVGTVLHLVRAVMISNRARAWFRHTTALECAHLYAQVGFSDAAACALWDAALKGVMGILGYLIPGCLFRSRVAFGEKSSVRGMCIVRIRLGNLLTATLMGAFAYVASGNKRKEEKKWSIIPLKT